MDTMIPNDSLHVNNKVQFKSQRENLMKSLDMNLFGISSIIALFFELNDTKIARPQYRNILHAYRIIKNTPYTEYAVNMFKFRSVWYNYGGEWNENMENSLLYKKILATKNLPATGLGYAPAWLKTDYPYFVRLTDNLTFDQFSTLFPTGIFPNTLSLNQSENFKQYITDMLGTVSFFNDFLKMCLDGKIKLKINTPVVIQKFNDPIFPAPYQPDVKTQNMGTNNGITTFWIQGYDYILRKEGRSGNNVVWQSFTKTFSKTDGTTVKIQIPTIGTPPVQAATQPKDITKMVNDNAANQNTQRDKKTDIGVETPPEQEQEAATATTTLVVGAGLALLLLA
jgi:hypothetical protein